MNVRAEKGNVILSNLRDFDLRNIFECGQCFRFNRTEDNIYTGVAYNHPLMIEQRGDTAILYNTSEDDFYGIWYNYFDFQNDYTQIKNELSRDPIMRDAVKYGDGIRILNQNPWEMIISFIISSSNNIPRIKGIIERMCASFGDEINYMDKSYYSFPSINALAKLDRDDLSVLRAGYRDKYIIDAAEKFNSGKLSADILNSLDNADAKKALMSIKGIGEKVANCIMLFGLKRMDAFPVDVWIKRIMEYCYFNSEEQSINTISEFARDKFGALGGYAQQYLFFYARENKIGLERHTK